MKHTSQTKYIGKAQHDYVHNKEKQKNRKEPTPITIIQSYVARNRVNQAKTVTLLLFETPKYTTKKNRSVVNFNEVDFMIKWVDRCKFNLIGEFSNTMPKVKLIRQSFIN